MAHGLDPTQRKFVVHVDIDIDNGSTHNARVRQNIFEHNPLKTLRHPPYSPDISPSDLYFDLLGKVKNALIGREISDEVDLLEVVTEILSLSSLTNCTLSFPVGLG
jgi:transposase